MCRWYSPAMGYCSELPSIRANSVLNRMSSRWNGPIGEAVRRYGVHVFPGVPAPMLLALSDNSITGREAISLANFWEVGLYQVPAGDDISRPPTSHGPYYDIANGERCRAILGREAVTGSGWADDIPGQVVVGLLNFEREGRKIVGPIAAAVEPKIPSSPWTIACDIYGYVRSTGAVEAIRQHEQALLGFDETQRPAALAWLVAKDFADGAALSSSKAYPIKRSLDRMLLGKNLAKSVGESTAWWPDFGPSLPAVEHWLTLAKYGDPESRCAASVVIAVGEAPRRDRAATAGSAIHEIATAGIVAIAVVSIGYAAWRRMDRGLPLLSV